MSIKNNTNFKKCAHKCTLTYAIMVSDELEITNAFHTYFPVKANYNVAPQHCLCTSRVGTNVADVNKKIGIKLTKPPCNRYKRRVWIANSPRKRLLLILMTAVRSEKAYRNIAQQRRAEAFQHSCRWFKPICSDHVREARECRFS